MAKCAYVYVCVIFNVVICLVLGEVELSESGKLVLSVWPAYLTTKSSSTATARIGV
jgi:hypothetical protein